MCREEAQGVTVRPLSARATLLLACAVAMTTAGSAPSLANDYPTEARADYVFACMASNGQTRKILERCSCSIDVIASIVPYERYVEAETVLRMRRISGEKSVIFKVSPQAKTAVDDLKRAQVESEVRCF